MGKAGGDEVAAGGPAVSPLGLVPVGGLGRKTMPTFQRCVRGMRTGNRAR